MTTRLRLSLLIWAALMWALVALPLYVGYLDCHQGYGSSNTILVCTRHWMGQQETAVFTWQSDRWEPSYKELGWR